MTKLKVDIILDSTSGMDSAIAIQGMLKKYPGLRPLSLIVKYLLMLRNQNEVFTGGLGGYAVVCLVVSFLQVFIRCTVAIYRTKMFFIDAPKSCLWSNRSNAELRCFITRFFSTLWT